MSQQYYQFFMQKKVLLIAISNLIVLFYFEKPTDKSLIISEQETTIAGLPDKIIEYKKKISWAKMLTTHNLTTNTYYPQ